MADFDNNTDNTSSSSGSAASGSGSTDSSSSKPDDTTSEAQLKPQDTPVVANTESNAENTEAGQAESRSRSLGEKSIESSIEKTPDQIRQEEMQRKIGEAVVKYNLNNIEAQNLAVSASQPGIELTPDFIKKQVQAIAPVKLEIAEIRDRHSFAAANIDPALSAQLPSQSVGKSQERSPTLAV